MEIAPIPGIRELSPARMTGSGLRPPAVFEIESTVKPEEEGAGSDRNSRKGAGGEDPEEDGPLFDEEGKRSAGNVDLIA